MTDFMPKRKTFLGTIIEHSFQDLSSKTIHELNIQMLSNVFEQSSSKMTPCSISYSQHRNNQVFQMKKSSALLGEVKNFWNDFNFDGKTDGDDRYITSNLSSHFLPAECFEITTINESYSIKTCIELIKEVYDASPDFYGVVLKNESIGGYINPLHPLIAQAQCEGSYPLSGKFKIIFYTLKRDVIAKIADNPKILRYKNEILFDRKYDKAFFESIISAVGSIIEEEESYEKIVSIDSTQDFKIKYSIGKFDKNGNQIEELSSEKSSFLIPVQLINNGMVFPYYGMVNIEETSGSYSSGIQLSPMQSCNVASIQMNNGEVLWNSVCTGNLPNNSDAGRKSLNHANLGSPYFRNILLEGSMRYAQIANQISLNIYARKFGIATTDMDIDMTIPMQIPEKMTLEQYKAMYPDSKPIDYLAYVKSIRMLELERE